MNSPIKYGKLIMLLVDHDYYNGTAIECNKCANTTIFSFGNNSLKEIAQDISTHNVIDLASAVEAVMKYYG